MSADKPDDAPVLETAMSDEDCWDWLSDQNQYCVAWEGSDNGDAPAVDWVVEVRGTEEFVAQGETPCDAIRAARKALGVKP